MGDTEMHKFIIRLLQNIDNPKTMDYWYAKFLNLNSNGFNDTASLNFNIKSSNDTINSAQRLIERAARTAKQGDICFVLHLFKHHLFPKCRTLRILNRKKSDVLIRNPEAGKTVEIKSQYSSFVYTTIQPENILKEKYLVLYRRNSWNRKHNLVIYTDEEDADCNENVEETK